MSCTPCKSFTCNCRISPRTSVCGHGRAQTLLKHVLKAQSARPQAHSYVTLCDQSGHAALRSCTELPCPVLCSPCDFPAAHDRHRRPRHELQLVHHHAARPGAAPLRCMVLRPRSAPNLLLRNRLQIQLQRATSRPCHAACVGTCTHLCAGLVCPGPVMQRAPRALRPRTHHPGHVAPALCKAVQLRRVGDAYS